MYALIIVFHILTWTDSWLAHQVPAFQSETWGLLVHLGELSHASHLGHMEEEGFYRGLSLAFQSASHSFPIIGLLMFLKVYF